MFSLTRTTPVGGDCTAGYHVNLDKEYTLQEFIDAVLTTRANGAASKLQEETALGITIQPLGIAMVKSQTSLIFRKKFMDTKLSLFLHAEAGQIWTTSSHWKRR